MNKVFLINENTLKNETILNDNVGAEYIMPAIETSQDIYLQQLIGTMLLDKLYNLIDTNTINNDENAHYKTLIDDYITNYLKYKVLSEITIPLAYKYRNAGIVQNAGEHYNNSQMKDAVLVQNHYELRANFYAQRLTQYLNANADLFPEYLNKRDNTDMMANRDSYQTNILL